MGLLRSHAAARPPRHSAAVAPTPLQFAPEKLPMDQLVRFTISCSLAKVMKKSVTAEQM